MGWKFGKKVTKTVKKSVKGVLKMGSNAGTVIGAGLDIMTGGLSGGAFTALGKTYDSKKQYKKEQRRAEEQQALEQQAIAKQKQAALEARKSQIDEMRSRYNARSDATKSSTGTKGVRAIISDTTLG